MNSKWLMLTPFLLLMLSPNSSAQSWSKALEVMLIGRWEMDMSHWKVQLEKNFKAERPIASDTLSEAQWQQLMDKLLDKASPALMLFRADKTYTYYILNPRGKQKMDEGSWEINSGHLFLIPDKEAFKNQKEKMKIKELNKKRLIIRTANEHGSFKEWVFHRVLK